MHYLLRQGFVLLLHELHEVDQFGVAFQAAVREVRVHQQHLAGTELEHALLYVRASLLG